MLYPLAAILFVLWILGFATAYTLGGFLHFLLVIAAMMIAIELLSVGRTRFLD